MRFFKNAVGRGGLRGQLNFTSVCESTAERICDRVSSSVRSSRDISDTITSSGSLLSERHNLRIDHWKNDPIDLPSNDHI